MLTTSIRNQSRKRRGSEERKMNKTINEKEEISEIAKPSNYFEGRKYEPEDVIRDWDLNFNLGNAVKYISMYGRKQNESSLKDLKKARKYLDSEISAQEKVHSGLFLAALGMFCFSFIVVGGLLIINVGIKIINFFN